MTLPVLSGPRVRLVPASYDASLAVVTGADPGPSLLPLTPGPGWPTEDTVTALRPLAEHGAPGDDGGWWVTVSGEVIGECGWHGGPDADGAVELGYALAPAFRGQGLGTEAVGVLCAWADTQPGVTTLTARVLPGNEPSVRLLRRLGFVDAGAPDPPWVTMIR